MTKYFAVIHDDDRWGPFDSIHEPMALLNQTSRDRGHTDEQSHDFFLNQSAVEAVDDGMEDQ
jgi:hypothetical protein